MQNKLVAVLARLVVVVLFFAGLFFVSQAYTMAFHGVYIDCFGPGGCGVRQFADPTLPSALYGTVLALVALGTFYLGARTLRWLQKK